MRRGSICWVNLGPTHPPEFGKTRPGVVVSNSVQNAVIDSVVVLPLSTQPGEIWPLRVGAGIHLGKASFAVLPGIRQVSKARIGDHIDTVDDDHMVEIDRALVAYLSE